MIFYTVIISLASANENYFVMNCSDGASVFMPIQFINMTVICNQTNQTSLLSNFSTNNVMIVGDIVTITVIDLDGNEVRVQELPPDHEIVFFVPLSFDGIQLMNQYKSKQDNLACIWFENNNTMENIIQTTGTYLAPISEFGDKNKTDIIGRYCKTNHLASFSLILRDYETESSIINRTIFQYVFTTIFGILTLLAIIQMVRAWIVVHKFIITVRIHLVIAFGTMMMILFYSIFPMLMFSQELIILFSSIIISIELCCYI